MTAPSRAHMGLGTYTTPLRDRPIHSMSVPCPSCGAAVDDHCVTATGKRAVHKTRRRMAIRAENAAGPIYSGADVDYVRNLSPNERRKVRRVGGLSVGEVAEVAGVSRFVISHWENGKMIPSGPEGAAYGKWLRSVMGR